MSSVLRQLSAQVIPVIRMQQAETALTAVDWLHEGGIEIFEITASVPGYLEVIAKLAERKDLLVGAGTLLSAEDAHNAVKAGARFLVSPCLVPEVIEAGSEAGIPVIPGTATPTEALQAHRLGAEAVKVFPARQLGGPGYLKALRSVLPDIAVIPTGGIELDEVDGYFTAGAYAVGIGGQLVTQDEVGEARTTQDETGETARQRVVARARRLSARADRGTA
ncbi:bifunctional 4-hydroxy-2-oxoglutarate aldolase/2-dehydro-3-deoxy-phosphogluconate aldolase [Fodinicurvata sediminis]|uniref:bifunctional 4-hydroxy-2-oxoglutarate aldolase/2-dehydro-3-deoxy-phosphogluconate aldolase n=1 Tax=Fodinicurvata sediminis TaxID=1121832 RepID=UPI0003B5B605|nr:bifunctional 4-hydroxy-2-oxoglutarate aldolase/2-dehydro-3-deoxy-phosphogluconate aldolase [Fodinicurvata sediminis]